jgi:protein subunit release factor A
LDGPHFRSADERMSGPRSKESGIMVERIIVEIRAAESGSDAKLLVSDMLAAYVKAGDLHCL